MSVGPEPDFSNDEVFGSRFPVHRACRDGDVGVLVSLLQQLSNRTHLTAEDSSYGWTPLHWAAHYGQLECVVHLAQMGCDVNTVTSRFNQTPTHTAAFGGHPQCVVWLTQAGADVNRQDFVGEAPIHKAARSGSLECIQVLLIAGAKPYLQNASGQTAADLALAHGFHEGFLLLSKTQKHLQQLAGVHLNGVQNGNGAPCGQELHSRKRLLNAAESGHMKRARRADDVAVQMHNEEGDELESMNTESAQEMNSDEDTKAFTNGYHHTLPYDQEASEPQRSPSPSPPPANQQAAPPSQRSSSEMCGSLHHTGSPSSCVSHRPTWWGPLGGVDYGMDLHFGHYHGFGDTAEELSSSRLDYCSSVQAEQRYKQAVASSIHLYHGS
ncbi:ankyrin repeat domain-containing protein 10-like isoform X2 [Xyrichtys novacula]|uniref:Ankyrin repeat domain-containing protein 10-like isoform X2 n=1 Tax=Xyrichtys novacula TaxID=13765 RepID=A0AAV1HPU1_XYRNO|nr:ankyrin repeat domain-containing protein 10-like isoform X2 [Xyrichtys novacula]